MACSRSVSFKQQRPGPQGKFLSGWKEIARYLGKGVRTVQRYERDLHLPVHRPAGKPFGSVVVSCRELDEWVSASPRKSLESSPRIVDLKNGVSELHRLCAEGRELRAALREQRAAVQFGVARLVKAVSEPVVVEGEWHRAVATVQKAHAADMGARALQMTESAIEMRKPARHLIVNA